MPACQHPQPHGLIPRNAAWQKGRPAPERGPPRGVPMPGAYFRRTSFALRLPNCVLSRTK